jgi:hypothetical protein
MNDQEEVTRAQFDTLEGIRVHFEALQRASGKGYHALGEEVLSTYWRQDERLPKPASAMTFRNFLQGKTTLRDPTGLELYFVALGAGEAEMRIIRATLQHERDRRLAAPRAQATLRAFDDLDLGNMPYSRALAECEVVTRIEDSISGPSTSLTPREYLFGRDGPHETGPDPERWGVLQHMSDLTDYLTKLHRAMAERREAMPRTSRRARRLHAAADLRESGSAYTYWTLARPGAGELFYSRRRFMLHGYFPETERQRAIEGAQQVSRLLFGFLQRFIVETLAGSEDEAAALCGPRAENALEVVGGQLFAILTSFYPAVVQGSLGTSGMFRALYQIRHRNRAAAPDYGPAHEALVSSYDSTIEQANRELEANVRLPYSRLKSLYDEQFQAARSSMLAIWETDFAPSYVRQTLQLLLGELHRQHVLDDERFLSLTRELLLGEQGQELAAARHPVPLYPELLA